MTLRTISPALEALIGPARELPHLAQALTHPSFANEHKQPGKGSASADYQRLEFLGDAVIGLVVSEELMRRFPEAREGELSQLRAHIVSTEALAAFARELGVGAALRVGRGALASKDRDQVSVLADAVEAVVAAVHLDKGVGAARVVILEIIERGLASSRPVRDPKSALQERIQSMGGAAPVYRMVSSEGPDHARDFVVEVDLPGGVVARGQGRSKKAAEQAAAAEGLRALETGA